MSQRHPAIIKLFDGTIILARNCIVKEDRLLLEGVRWKGTEDKHRSSCDSIVIHMDAAEVFFLIHRGD